jgi:hypothetical protein
MSLSMYAASAPILDRQLGNMLGWFDKAQAHADARGFDSGNYLGLRLAPDMLPFASQIRIASDTAKGCVSRLAGAEVPKWADDEATLDQLRSRILKTLEHVRGFVPAQIDGSETREIVLPMRNREPLRFDGVGYLQRFALPNFFFHATTAYALLRHAGVPLGKADFLGG